MAESVFFQGASEGRILPHALGDTESIAALRRCVEAYVKWADTRISRTYPSVFLSAAVIDEGGLRRLMEQVVREIYEIAPPQHAQPAVQLDSSSTEQEQSRLAVFRILNGFMLLDEVVLGAGRQGVRRTGATAAEKAGRTIPRAVNPADQSAFVEMSAPGIARNRLDTFLRLLTPQLRRKQGAKGVLPSKSILGDLGGTTVLRHAIFHEALMKAADDFEHKLDDILLDTGAMARGKIHRELVLSIKRSRRAIAQHEFTMRLERLLQVIDGLRESTEKWLRESLPSQKRGRGENQKIKKRLRPPLAYVCQYAWLLYGNRYTDDVIDAALHMKWLGSTLLTVLEKLPGGINKEKQPVPRLLLADFDNMVIRPGVLAQWRTVLGDRAPVVGKFCCSLVGKQGAPWRTEDEIARYEDAQKLVYGVKKDRGSVTARRRQEAFVMDCLRPMQALGLAAEAPWDELWVRASNQNKPLKTHKGKKWVVNPFGLNLAGEDGP